MPPCRSSPSPARGMSPWRRRRPSDGRTWVRPCCTSLSRDSQEGVYSIVLQARDDKVRPRQRLRIAFGGQTYAAHARPLRRFDAARRILDDDAVLRVRPQPLRRDKVSLRVGLAALRVLFRHQRIERIGETEGIERAFRRSGAAPTRRPPSSGRTRAIAASGQRRPAAAGPCRGSPRGKAAPCAGPAHAAAQPASRRGRCAGCRRS